MPRSREEGLPIEEFIQALTGQLDRAQATLGLKAKLGMPLTFAVKEIAVDLRAHVDMVGNEIVIRPVAPSDQQASVIHLNLTTITRPVIEENTLSIESDEPTLKEVLGDDVSEEEQKRLQWAGIHNVSQLRELERQAGGNALQQIVQIPVGRLQKALQRASRPRIKNVRRIDSGRLRITGANLRGKNNPRIKLDGNDLRVLSAEENEVIVESPTTVLSGTLSVDSGADEPVELSVDETEGLVVTVDGVTTSRDEP